MSLLPIKYRVNKDKDIPVVTPSPERTFVFVFPIDGNTNKQTPPVLIIFCCYFSLRTYWNQMVKESQKKKNN